ncbi:hypothetical protein M9H77_27310 [Catharanthus roseus]|uniref:Uncharacterized protein n=1 Tax=Catharanthus roseus TaxID=4058 RepID=A0ACC0AEV1_CATRO|nr:hypothetical protein M9H77_27310 [Catharanthus roseus]
MHFRSQIEEAKRKAENAYSITNGFFAFNVFQNTIQVTSKTERGLGYGASSKSRTSSASSASVSATKDSPECSSGEEQRESLSNRWPQETVLSNSFSAKAPFPLTAVVHTVTRRLTGTDQQMRVPKGRTEKRTDKLFERRERKTEGQRARGGSGCTSTNERIRAG